MKSQQKAKPVVRRGRKATGLAEIAGLPGKGSAALFFPKSHFGVIQGSDDMIECGGSL
jgi:hypothetical protein